MFPIVALAGLALSAGSTIAGHIAQNKQAAANRRAAIADFKLRAADIAARRSEEAEATRLDLAQARTASLVEQGQLQLSLAENGVAGNTAAVASNTLARGLSDYTMTALANLRLTDRALDRAMEGGRAEMHSRIAGVPNSSLAGTGIRLGGNVVDYLNLRLAERE